MDSNQTIQLKPVYPHSHISIYNAPVISATMPTFSITSGLSMVGTAKGENSDDIDLATIHSAAGMPSGHAQLVPINANNVCLNGIQIQPVHVPQSFTQAQLTSSNGLNNGGQAACGNLLQIQITTPSVANAGTCIGINGNSSATAGQIISRACLVSDTNSNLSNGSSTSASSEANSQCDIDSAGSRNIKNDPDSINSDYVSLTRASCNSSSGSTNENSGAINMQLDLTGSNSFSTFRTSNNVKGFLCQVCNRHFTQKGNLKTHLMTHSGERPYECRICGKNFTQKGNLDTHVKIHTETKDHKCQYCDRGFTQRGNLKTHIRSVHTKEKPYACGHCGKAFSQKGNMLTHFKTHDKGSRFPCQVCGKTFSQKVCICKHNQL